MQMKRFNVEFTPLRTHIHQIKIIIVCWFYPQKVSLSCNSFYRETNKSTSQCVCHLLLLLFIIMILCPSAPKCDTIHDIIVWCLSAMIHATKPTFSYINHNSYMDLYLSSCHCFTFRSTNVPPSMSSFIRSVKCCDQVIISTRWVMQLNGWRSHLYYFMDAILILWTKILYWPGIPITRSTCDKCWLIGNLLFSCCRCCNHINYTFHDTRSPRTIPATEHR